MFHREPCPMDMGLVASGFVFCPAGLALTANIGSYSDGKPAHRAVSEYAVIQTRQRQWGGTLVYSTPPSLGKNDLKEPCRGNSRAAESRYRRRRTRQRESCKVAWPRSWRKAAVDRCCT